uniref:Uncharacterized protein n=1 Tax=Romanomermis culicivorax TaxID=13658 RepID=A0A915HIL4_ROMCU
MMTIDAIFGAGGVVTWLEELEPESESGSKLGNFFQLVGGLQIIVAFAEGKKLGAMLHEGTTLPGYDKCAVRFRKLQSVPLSSVGKGKYKCAFKIQLRFSQTK